MHENNSLRGPKSIKKSAYIKPKGSKRKVKKVKIRIVTLTEHYEEDW